MKIFADHISNIVLVSRIYTFSKQGEKTSSPLKKVGKDLTDT